jgi:hypothetical protein
MLTKQDVVAVMKLRLTSLEKALTRPLPYNKRTHVAREIEAIRIALDAEARG